MSTYDLPYYENVLCARMSFIEPFCTDWEAVNVNHLIELKSCLVQEWINFQRAIFADMQSGFCGSYCVRSIYYTLKKFSKWFYNLKDVICKALNHTIHDIVQKAAIAKDIANAIEVIWIPFIWERYEELKKESQRLPETLTSNEFRQTKMQNIEEEKRETALRNLYSVIIGTTREEKIRKSEILREVLNGMKGKTVATYIQAAIELNWLSEVPEFSAMKMFWGVEGSHGAVSKMFSTVGGSLIKEENVENAKKELKDKLSASNI